MQRENKIRGHGKDEEERGATFFEAGSLFHPSQRKKTRSKYIFLSISRRRMIDHLVVQGGGDEEEEQEQQRQHFLHQE